MFGKKEDPFQKREEVVDELREERRQRALQALQNKIDNYNDTHDKQIRLFEVPGALTFE